jgi:hypothetical protein
MKLDSDLQKEVALLRRARRWTGIYWCSLLSVFGWFFSWAVLK